LGAADVMFIPAVDEALSSQPVGSLETAGVDVDLDHHARTQRFVVGLLDCDANRHALSDLGEVA
jgi:hypothetical protein